MRYPEGRLRSLDAFRGLTIAAMVLVNNPGTWTAVYRPLTHAEWHGWTPTDLVFPFFLFIVGVSITLALGRRRAAGDPDQVLAARVTRRAAIIFALGLALNVIAALRFGVGLDTVRWMGVLQRIALCYLVAALLFLWFGWRTQAAIAAGLLLGYWGLLTLVPVPGFGAGDLGKEGSLAAWLDRLLLGPHIWRGGKVYDPEGLLSTLPAIATTLAGVLGGHWLATPRSPWRTLAPLALAGAAAVGVGLAWGAWFPINKSLWTSSYALFTAGAAALGLAACVGVVDVAGYRRWATPFVVFGTNALALFFLSTLAALLLVTSEIAQADGGSLTLHAVLYRRLFASWASPVNASLAWAVAYLLVWLGVMGLLYRRRIFIRV
ncbi:MAG: acyltransferase family protein [Candidatus Rokuibacteriota bacterium]